MKIFLSMLRDGLIYTMLLGVFLFSGKTPLSAPLIYLYFLGLIILFFSTFISNKIKKHYPTLWKEVFDCPGNRVATLLALIIVSLVVWFLLKITGYEWLEQLRQNG